MANYRPTVLTKSGFSVLQNVIQGNIKLEFSKIKIGIGQVVGDISDLTDLVDSKIEANITAIKNNDDGSCSVCGSYTNEGMTESYTLNEIGVFVKDSDGNDVLYAYSTADGEGDWFGAGSTLLQENIEVLVYVATASNITANITHTVKSSDVDVNGTDLESVLGSIGEETESIRNQIVQMGEATELTRITIEQIVNDLNNVNGDLTELSEVVDAHNINYDNPHRVNKSQVGLSNVQNYNVSSEVNLDSDTTYATSRAVKNVNVANSTAIDGISNKIDSKGSETIAQIVSKGNETITRIDSKASEVVSRVDSKASEVMGRVDTKTNEVLTRIDSKTTAVLNQINSKSVIKSIQRGNVSLNNNTLEFEAYVTLSAVNTSKTIVISSVTSRSYSNTYACVGATATLKSSTSLRIYSKHTEYGEVSYEVVEFY